MSWITPVILCGGNGKRLWPLSTPDYPKQFLTFGKNFTLFQQTIKRALALENRNIKIKEVVILTNENYRFIVLEQIDLIKTSLKFKIILEPESRNTAPALTLASLASPNSNLVVMPCDHYFKSNRSFSNSAEQAINNIKKNNIFLLGVEPNSLNTSYGYIRYEGKNEIKKVSSFTEKPNRVLAKKIITEGKCLWNVGIFILKSNTWIEAIKKSNKNIFSNVNKSWERKINDNWFIRPEKKSYMRATNNSIDYVVLEKANKQGLKLNAIQLRTSWSDLGDYRSLNNIINVTKKNNVFKGSINELDTQDLTVIAENRNVSVLGVKDLIIVETKDDVLVADKNNTSLIKKFVTKINNRRKNSLDLCSKVFRPWGMYEVIHKEQGYLVKKLIIKSKAELSLQSHKKRNEHWIITKGIATIKKNDKTFVLKKDESTYIAAGDKHKIINEGRVNLEILEVQTGSKISESDIIRYDDIYGRK